jgi:hypothetical protein
MKKSRIRKLIFVALSSLLLSACSSDVDDTSSSSTAISSEDNTNRPSPSSVLAKWGGKNYTLSITYRYLANQTTAVGSSVPTPVFPIVTAKYISTGFEYDFGKGWDEAKENYGYVTIPTGSSLGTVGTHQYSLDADKKLVLGELKSDKDAYEYLYTPDYLYKNATAIGSSFNVDTGKSEINRLTDTQYLDNIAKALSVYGPLKAVSSTLTFACVDLKYSASSSSYRFTFYVDDNEKFGGSSTYNASANYPVGAVVDLSKVGTTTLPVVTNYLGGK